MAGVRNVSVTVMGGQSKTLDGVESPRCCLRKLGLGENYTVTVNRESANLDTKLTAFDTVIFTTMVKGN